MTNLTTPSEHMALLESSSTIVPPTAESGPRSPRKSDTTSRGNRERGQYNTTAIEAFATFRAY